MKTTLLWALPLVLLAAGEGAAHADLGPVIDGCNPGMFGPRGCLKQYIRFSDGGQFTKGGGTGVPKVSLTISNLGGDDPNTQFDLIPLHTNTYQIRKAGTSTCMQVGVAPDKKIYMGTCTVNDCMLGGAGDRCEWQLFGGNDPYAGWTFLRNVSIGDAVNRYCFSRDLTPGQAPSAKLAACAGTAPTDNFTKFGLFIDYAPIPEGPLVCGAKRTRSVEDATLIGPSGWNCSPSWIDHWWSAYDYDDTDWDDGNWGMNAMCDVTYPLARSLNADATLEKVLWAAIYAKGAIDQLDGEDCSTATAAWTIPGPKIDGLTGYTNLRIRYFYNYDAVARAGMLPHEGKHASFVLHSLSNSCLQGFSCDSSYNHDSPNSIEVDYLKDFAADCHNPLAQRQSAANRVNVLGLRVFNQQPGPTAPVPTTPGC